MLKINPMSLGPVETNAYLVADTETGQAVVIDPAWDGDVIAAAAQKSNWQIEAVWLTHAHFDHIGGTAALSRLVSPAPPVALHPDELPLYQMDGGAQLFGIQIESGPPPTLLLAHGQSLSLGGYQFEVRFTPGHTPGHVVYYCQQEQVVFCGDVIFRGGIGRADLPGSSYSALLDSIQNQIMTLPDETRLFSGHGPETTVGRERISNPFLI